MHHISCVKSCDSQHDCVIIPNKDEQELCPGYDVLNEAPVGCFVLTDALVKKGVIHQWIVFFQKGGWSVLEDHTEIRRVKYPWLRAGGSF